MFLGTRDVTAGRDTSSVDWCGGRRPPPPPPAGQTYLVIGQDLFSVDNYLREQYNYSLHQYLRTTVASNRNSISSSSSTFVSSRKRPTQNLPQPTDALPTAFMVYTDLQSLRGLYAPTDYGSGVEFADGLLQLSSTTTKRRQDVVVVALQIGLWLNGSQGCRDLVQGQLEPQLDGLYHYLANCRAPKVYLRVGYEFDNPSFGYDDSDLYQRAFRRLVLGCRQHSEACRNKVAFVWHSWAASTAVNLPSYYPGDDVVDWIGISLFSQFYTNATTAIAPLGSRETIETVVQFAQQCQKPIMIAESTPFGGILALHDPWNDWFVPVLQLIDQYNIGMWSYIHCDWDSQPMWHNVGFGDTRLDVNETIMQLWQQNVLRNPRFANTIQPCRVPSLRPSLMTSLSRVSVVMLSDNPMMWYLLPILAITFLAVSWCVGCSTITRTDKYEPLINETEDDEVVIAPDRTGYGTLN